MNNINKFKHLIMLSLIGAFVLSGCNKNDSTGMHEKTLVLDETKMMTHLQAFQNIAIQNNGNRAVGTAGGKQSAEYILDYAEKMGYKAQTSTFENSEKTKGQNIMIEIPGESKETIIVGTHYDSVKAGPGINDNASGVALLLELMHEFSTSKIKPKHTIYLAFWDSEEIGVAGSQFYVQNLKADQLKNIKAYINIDMIGTRDPTILIADANKSSLTELEKTLKDQGVKEAEYKPLLDNLRAIPSHAGDLALENSLKEFFAQQKLNIKEDIMAVVVSDSAPFVGKVPLAIIALHHEKMHNDELEFVPCYHKDCDTIDKVDPKSLSLVGKAIVYLIKDIEAQ